ncbi:DNA-methyltransferase [Lacticaseibacillus paracasei]|uniref:DNA-methyltransferase n=1 Tax=Lacticaseibacillus paracasei TaxID=1597 RepID=UPI002F262D84
MIDLRQGDCLELMKDIPDGSIDMILTDPPYLQGYKTNRRKNKHHEFSSEILNDTSQTGSYMIVKFLKLSYQKLRNNSAILVFCNTNKIDFFKQEIENTGFKIKNIIVWVKNNHTAGDLKASFGHQYEFVILANKGRRYINGNRDNDVMLFDKVVGKGQLHQNQKPVALLKYLVEKLSDSNDAVLDPFMGSGSTGVACVNTGRSFIGMELEDKYFKIAEQRINEARRNVELF